MKINTGHESGFHHMRKDLKAAWPECISTWPLVLFMQSPSDIQIAEIIVTHLWSDSFHSIDNAVLVQK